MTLITEPAPSLDPSDLPGDPAAYRRRGPGLLWWLAVVGVAVWTVVIMVATIWVMSLVKPAPDGQEPHAAIGNPFVHAPMTVAPPPAEPAPVDTAVMVAAPPSTSETAALASRLERVELDQRRASEAAAGALAAASLAEAAQSDAPFDAELSAIGGLLPASVDLRALQRLAGQGAPTRAALAAQFAEIAARTAVASRAPPKGSGVLARVAHALAGIITIRRTDHATGDGADALLARAQTKMQNGDLPAAVAELDKLPAPGKQALAAWRAQAQRRLDIDRQISAIRAAALRELSQNSGERP
jgi:hypothetical protein